MVRRFLLFTFVLCSLDLHAGWKFNYGTMGDLGIGAMTGWKDGAVIATAAHLYAIDVTAATAPRAFTRPCEAQKTDSPPQNVAVPTKFQQYAHITPRIEKWAALVKQRDFAALDTEAAELQNRWWSADPMHWDIDAFTIAISGNPEYAEEQRIAFLREWIAKRPQTVVARAALANALVGAAAARRGGGFDGAITESGQKEMNAFLVQAREVLAATTGAERIPAYWSARLVAALNLDTENAHDVARLAVKACPDPELVLMATSFALPKWGGSPKAVRELAEEVAAMTANQWGDTMYMWVAYQAWLQMGRDDYAATGLSWDRISQGCRDLMAIAPQWLPTYHRFALLAKRNDDRITARELFSKPELEWYDGAEKMWKTRDNYEMAKIWALTSPMASEGEVLPRVKRRSAQ
jgi:hypothetical protein